jgi:two-component system, sensor histidine kinase and response regulator
MESGTLKQVEANLWLHGKILEHMAEGVCLVRATDGIIVYTSPVTDRMFGYARGELTGQSISITTTMTDYDLRETGQSIAQVLQQRSDWKGEIRSRRKDGTAFWCGVHISLFDHPDFGTVWLALCEDITERKAAEEKLAEQHTLLRTLIDTLPDFIYVKDTQGRYLMSNIANAERLGTTPEQIVGKWDFDFFPADTAEKLYADEQIIIRTGQPILRREDMGTSSDGAPIWMLITKAPLYDQKGNIVGIVGINRDITVNKQVQQQIENARRRAEETSQLKTQFLTTMSHELRTPLNAIIGFSDMLLKGILGEVSDIQKEYIRDILSNGEHLLAIINDVLDISKIESGQFRLNIAPLDPNHLLEHVRRRLQGLAEAKGLAFITFLDPALPPMVTGDALRLRQILINLIGNAIKFTERGEVEVRFEAVEDARWQIVVRDTGIGIPTEAINYLFEEFRQVDNSLERAYEGTGLGLAIVRNLALRMGGTVEVDSAVGSGSTFTVCLPLILHQEERGHHDS